MTLADGLIDRRVRALAVGSDGHVRVGTVAALSDIDGAQITNVTQAQGLRAGRHQHDERGPGRQPLDRHGYQRRREDSGLRPGELFRSLTG